MLGGATNFLSVMIVVRRSFDGEEKFDFVSQGLLEFHCFS